MIKQSAMLNWLLREQEKKIHSEEVKKRTLDEENDILPMTIQELEIVEDITINDLSFLDGPGCYYSAYLHTAWEVYILHGSGFFELGQSRPANLELVKRQVNIHVGIFDNGITLDWKTGWLDVYKDHIRTIEVYD